MVGTRIRTFAVAVRIAVFLGIIGLPLAGALCDNRFSGIEDMRSLAPFPEVYLKVSILKLFPVRFEQYWNDHFGFRGTLIRALNMGRLHWLHAPSFGNVLIGQASWLFFTWQQPGMDYETIRPFTEDELDHWQRVLEHRRDWLQRRGCRYLLFIPPDKQTIYPEKIDPRYRQNQTSTRLDQLLTHLHNHRANVTVLDIRQSLLAAKERERLYHRTDTHWNDRGAFIGYQRLTTVLANWFPVIEAKPRSDFEEVETSQPGGDLARMLPVDGWSDEQWLQLLPRTPRYARPAENGVVRPATVPPVCPPFATECDDPRLPRAVIFHDSFAAALQPFLSEHFRRIAYVGTDDFQQTVVENERPEVVIQELLERKLAKVVPNDIEE